MKKKWFPVLVICLGILFVCGLNNGSFAPIVVSAATVSVSDNEVTIRMQAGEQLDLRECEWWYASQDFNGIENSTSNVAAIRNDILNAYIKGNTTMTVSIFSFDDNGIIVGRSDLLYLYITVTGESSTQGQQTQIETEKVKYSSKKPVHVESKYTNFKVAQIEKASTRGTNQTILGEFWDSNVGKDKELIKILKAVSFSTNDGEYGYTEDWFPELLQEKVKTVDDVWAYLYYSGYCYAEDDQGYMSSVFGGWNKQNSAKINIEDNCGVCCETAMVVNYLLEGDYEETGSVMVTSDSGHVYNYIKADGIYYLVDFTDFTGNKSNQREIDVYNEWKDRICFWSGTSLKDPSCTKAVLIHDTYEDKNHRTNLNLDWNYDHTGWIVAIRYENGMEGDICSILCDYNYQSTICKDGGRYVDGIGKVLPTEFGCYLPQYTVYQTLWINDTTRYCGAKWVEGGTIKLKYVPWYCNISPKAQKKMKETQVEKMLRQFDAVDKTFNYNEVHVAAVWELMYNPNRRVKTLDELERVLGRTLKVTSQ